MWRFGVRQLPGLMVQGEVLVRGYLDERGCMQPVVGWGVWLSSWPGYLEVSPSSLVK